MNRRSVLCAAVIGLFSLLPVLSHADSLADIKKRGTIRVAVPGDYPPFGSSGTDMQLVGYDIDMAKLVAKELGVKVELVSVVSANRIPTLQTHKVDIIISTLGATDERRKLIDFSNTYAPYYNSVYSAKGQNIHAATDLANKQVAVARGTIEDLELTKIVPSTTTIKRYEDNNTLISAYISGQEKILGTGNFVAATINQKVKDKPIEKSFDIRKSACLIGVNKGEGKLLAELNAIIAKNIANGTLNGFSVKWLNAPLPKDM